MFQLVKIMQLGTGPLLGEKINMVKIGEGVHIGDNNAIGENAKVEITTFKDKRSSNWFSNHPWLSAIIASTIAGIILMFNFWSQVVTFLEETIKRLV